MQLKSDQNGIESSYFLVFLSYFRIMLKSDQNGIESELKENGREHKKALLKSDQNGIESLSRTVRCAIHWCRWNQTKMGLKVERFIDRQGDVFVVEIRPKWDWKLCSIEITKFFISSLKSDQNGIERMIKSLPIVFTFFHIVY